MAFSNSFAWSLSRESMFDDCRRRYYFHYYLSWGGWTASASLLSRETFKLKRLTSLSLWRGQLVHYIATKVLASMRKKGRIPPSGDVRNYTIERFNRQFDFSREKLYLSEPKKRGGKLNIDWLALFEHEYDRELSGERKQKTLEECVQGINGLLESPILSIIAETDPLQWVIENIDLAEFAQVFSFGGTRVFAKTDFIFRGSDGTFNIVDWKTFRLKTGAKPDSGKGRAGVQLGVYGYYAAKILKEPLETIRLYEVNLLDEGRFVEHQINNENIDSFYDHIRRGISKMSSVLVGNDMDKNRPLPHEHFHKNESSRCRYCNFYRICMDGENPDRLL